jgi:transcriptional regulator with XRE-family HTH domain
LLTVPPTRKSKPLSPDHAALGRAIELLIAQDEQASQESVAIESGLNIRQVNAFVRGRGNPTYTTLLRLCRGLHVRLGELMTLTDELREKHYER